MEKKSSILHQPVLVQETLAVFQNAKLNTFVDCTLGLGGHSAFMLEAHPEIKRLIGIDQDPFALEIAKQRLKNWETKVDFIQGNFGDLEQHLSLRGIREIDGALFDLGLSSLQLEMSDRGFSFLREGPLDMRMDPTNPLTAEEVINSWPEKKLGYIFKEYGEEKGWRLLAKKIVYRRRRGRITTTKELAELLMPHLPKKRKIHPLTLVFQALRMAVNQEKEKLEGALNQMLFFLRKGGRIAIISFHSGEDRLVKHWLRRRRGKEVQILTEKPLCPTLKEMDSNPRSRSARLRIAERI